LLMRKIEAHPWQRIHSVPLLTWNSFQQEIL
jgi:hypothetical protein